MARRSAAVCSGPAPSRGAPGHLDEACAECERGVPGEVRDTEHFVSQRRHEKHVQVGEDSRHLFATFPLKRSACTKPTAERNRASRKRLGQACSLELIHPATQAQFLERSSRPGEK